MYTPSTYEPGIPPPTTYVLITRAAQPQTGVVFQNLPELCPPYGLDRNPPYQFIDRLKDFPPNLTDLVIVASTASIDVSLVTRSKSPLTSDISSDQITNVFTATATADDSRRAQLPMAENPMMDGPSDTSAIGMALDLSSKSKVARPLPKEEFDESPGPLPALMILNNEGILTSWWLVYADSIRQGTIYPGLAIVSNNQPPPVSQSLRQSSPFASSLPASNTPAFGQTGFQKPASTFGASTEKPASNAFGAPSAPAGIFGASSSLGKQSSPWGGQATNPSSTPSQAPAFGSATPMGNQTQGSAFGVAGGMGNRSSPWGASTGATPASRSVFGQASGLGSQGSPFGGGQGSAPFGAAAGPNQSSGGFASFAAKPSAFGSPSSAPAGSAFAKPATGSTFGSLANATSGSTNVFGQPSNQNDTAKPGFGSGGFTLGSTFKSDGTAASDGPKPSGNAMNSLFGSNFGESLGKAQTEEAPSKDADMEDDVDEDKTVDTTHDAPRDKNTPQLPAKTDSMPPTAPPLSGGLIGTQAQSSETPAKVQSSRPAHPTTEIQQAEKNVPKEIHINAEDIPSSKISPQIKQETESSDDGISPLREDEADVPDGFQASHGAGKGSSEAATPKQPHAESQEAPLPPESTSRASFAPGDSSSSSKSSAGEPAPRVAEPPLPPDPSPTKSKLNVVENAAPEQSKLPEEGDDALDDEGSGVDVAQEISSPSDANHSPKISPESSFGAPKSPVGGLFSKVQAQETTPRERPLFGEVGRSPIPVLPPPSKPQESPRSPSPVRHLPQYTSDSLRPDPSRSVSAPGPFGAAVNRKLATNQLAVGSREAHPSASEFRRREEQRILADRAKRTAEEKQDLSDDEDEQVRQEIQAPIAPSKSLDPFLAHQDYAGQVDKPGIPGQIERLYRDINSMIDTLGLNARSLIAFVKGHSEEVDEEYCRSLDDLENPDDWNLEEIPELKDLETELGESLETHRFEDLQHLSKASHEIRTDIAVLRQRRGDLTKTIESRKDADDADSKASAPLTLEQLSQQQDLRKRFLHYQKLLATAEEELSMLRAKLTSWEPSASMKSSVHQQPPLRKPTLEAVTKTILKMTSMIEKKSGDIDVLESQLRHLGLTASADGRPISSHSYGSSREGSPLASSLFNSRHVASRSSARKTANRQSKEIPFGRSPLRTSLLNSTSTTPSKKWPGNTFKLPLSPTSPRRYREDASADDDDDEDNEAASLVDEETAIYRAKAQRRKEINQLIRDVYEKSGPRIRPLDE